MRLYENFITANLVLDLPKQKFGRKKNGYNDYLERIYRHLVIYDQMDSEDFKAVIREAENTLAAPDYAFELFFHNDFEQYIIKERHKLRWEKMKKDYNAYIQSEDKRRGKESPYHVQKTAEIEAWEASPDFSRQKRNQPWQFDHIYRDSQQLAGVVYEITKNYEQFHDKDLFRAKINSILAPDKLIYALNSGEGSYGFAENEVSALNIKMSLEGYKFAYTFLRRVVESLHKARWKHEDKTKTIDETIYFAEQLLQKLKTRIGDMEKRFILFLDALE